MDSQSKHLFRVQSKDKYSDGWSSLGWMVIGSIYGPWRRRSKTLICKFLIRRQTVNKESKSTHQSQLLCFQKPYCQICIINAMNIFPIHLLKSLKSRTYIKNWLWIYMKKKNHSLDINRHRCPVFDLLMSSIEHLQVLTPPHRRDLNLFGPLKKKPLSTNPKVCNPQHQTRCFNNITS